MDDTTDPTNDTTDLTDDTTDLKILIEGESSAFLSGATRKAAVREAESALGNLGDAIRKSSARFLSALGEVRPDEIEISLKVSLTAEAGWIIVSGKTGATASVTLRWKKDKKDKKDKEGE